MGMRVSASFWAAWRSMSATAILQPAVANSTQRCWPKPPAPPVIFKSQQSAQLLAVYREPLTNATFPRTFFASLRPFRALIASVSSATKIISKVSISRILKWQPITTKLNPQLNEANIRVWMKKWCSLFTAIQHWSTESNRSEDN